MRIQRVTSVLIICTIMAVGAQAGGANKERSASIDKMAKNLNLSTEQVEKIKALKSEQRTQKKAAMADRQVMKNKGIALLDNFSSDAANSLANDAAEMTRSTTLARLDHMQSIYTLLNEAQKKKFKAMLGTDHSKSHKRK